MKKIILLFLIVIFSTTAYAKQIDADGNSAVDVRAGGTNATTASGARTNLGLGTLATQSADSVAITGGAISGITDLPVADGGTGASDASTARTNLGLGTMSTQDADSVAITGGTISGLTEFATSGYGAIGGANTNAGTLEVFQGADSRGVKIFGYDDKVASYFDMSLNAGGAVTINASANMTIYAPTSWLLMYSGDDVLLRPGNNDELKIQDSAGGNIMVVDEATYAATFSGSVTAQSFSTGSSSTPEVGFKDSDCTDSDTNASITANATATGSGVEIVDMDFKAQGVASAGVIGTFMGWDGSETRLSISGMANYSSETITCVSDAGAADVTVRQHYIVSDADADNDEDTVSLADGIAGDEVVFTFKTDTDSGDSVNITPGNFANGTKIVFDTEGESCHLGFDGTSWFLIGTYGGVVS